VKELASLRKHSIRLKTTRLSPGDANPLQKLRGELIELAAELEPGDVTTIFNVRGATIAWEGKTQDLVVAGHRSHAPVREGRQRLRIFCDRTALEVFASDGLTYVPLPFIPKPEDLDCAVRVEGGAAVIPSLVMYELKSCWR
jgi:fructan beta-fructosidase